MTASPKGADGKPTITMPDGHGNLVSAFHMPSECQTNGVGNELEPGPPLAACTHNHGFVEGSTGEAMGYFLGRGPAVHLGHGPHLPDRRSLVLVPSWARPIRIGGTCWPVRRLGQIDDSFHGDLPPNGTIFDLLNRYGITWKDYYSNLPVARGVAAAARPARDHAPI